MQLSYLELAVAEFDITGVGVWSAHFPDWAAFCHGLETGVWSQGADLDPDIIPARERRRAPQSVKMAVEVMGQACRMAGMNPEGLATVFSSAMGDMQITDSMCRTLAVHPELVSPTLFHNSVHNAPVGYWSIAMGSHAPATAVAAHQFSASIALLEAAVQCFEESTPVLLVVQDGDAPITLRGVCDSDHALSVGLLLTPAGTMSECMARVGFTVHPSGTAWPALPAGLAKNYSGNPSGRLLPLLAVLAQYASPETCTRSHGVTEFPLGQHTSLNLEILPVEPGTAP